MVVRDVGRYFDVMVVSGIRQCGSMLQLCRVWKLSVMSVQLALGLRVGRDQGWVGYIQPTN